jgi:hypothetical protein
MDDVEEFRLFCQAAGHFTCVEALDRFLEMTPEQREALRERFVREGLVKIISKPERECG